MWTGLDEVVPTPCHCGHYRVSHKLIWGKDGALSRGDCKYCECEKFERNVEEPTKEVRT